jgi:DNA-binding IclR family transcriptional regulator
VDEPAGPKRTQAITSVVNASRVLCEFGPEQREFSVRDLASRLGLSKSTVHRLLVSLAVLHLVEHNPDTGRYRLGLRMYELGTLVSGNIALHEAATPCLTDLRNRTGETVQVAVLDGREAIYVERLDSIHTLRIFARVGHRVAANCTANGKVLLAHLPDDELERLLDGWLLEGRTPHSITDPDALRRDLATVRRRGYGETFNEGEMGVASVAAAIRDRTGQVIASVSVAGPTTRMNRASLRAFAGLVTETAAAISHRLGYRPARSAAAGPPQPRPAVPPSGKSRDGQTSSA